MTRPSWDDTWMDVAAVMANRSLCSRDKVGAVIVDTQNRVVSTGYNGPPSGYMRQLPNSEVCGSPAEPCNHWCQRAQQAQRANYDLHPAYHDCPSIHAERNAIAWASGRDMAGGTLYVTSGVCFDCAKEVAAARIAQVVVMGMDRQHREPIKVQQFLFDCGVKVKLI